MWVRIPPSRLARRVSAAPPGHGHEIAGGHRGNASAQGRSCGATGVRERARSPHVHPGAAGGARCRSRAAPPRSASHSSARSEPEPVNADDESSHRVRTYVMGHEARRGDRRTARRCWSRASRSGAPGVETRALRSGARRSAVLRVADLVAAGQRRCAGVEPHVQPSGLPQRPVLVPGLERRGCRNNALPGSLPAPGTSPVPFLDLEASSRRSRACARRRRTGPISGQP